MVRDRAIPVSGKTGIYLLRDKVLNNNFSKNKTKGTVTKQNNLTQDHIEYDLKYGNLKNIKPLKIVVDTANAMGAQYIEELFKHLPCELIKMNFELDGNFPVHEADPFKEENVKDLQKKVVELNADLGISTDGDGDRIFFIDDKGKTIEPGILRAILSKIFLRDKPNSKIAYDIRPGKITPDTIIENGGTPIVTRVGHSLIKEVTIKENAYFAGESSGHFFLNMDIGCFEVPNIVILKILEELSMSNQKASEYIKPYQKYSHSGEINFEVDDKKVVLQNLEKKYNDGKINMLDGISVEYPDWWFNVRCSNTENKVRLNLEANSKKVMEQKRDEIIEIIKK
jgi:phosphomannomutase